MLALFAVLIFSIVNSLLNFFNALLYVKLVVTRGLCVCDACFLVSTKMPSKMPIAEFYADRLPNYAE